MLFLSSLYLEKLAEVKESSPLSPPEMLRPRKEESRPKSQAKTLEPGVLEPY